SMKEAKGWIGSGDSYIKMFVPKTLATEEMSINLKTSKTSNINFNGKQSNFNSLEFNVNRCDIYFDYLSAKIIKISANKSDVKVGKNVVGATQILYLDVGNSYIDFTEAGGARDQLNKNEPNFSKINFSISKVILQGAEKKSLIRIFKADEVVTYNQTVLNNGKFEAYYVGFLNVNVDDFDFEIVNLTDSNDVGYSYFTGKGEGSVKIHNCLAKINFITNSGDISINNPQDVLVLETKSGNIRVDNAKYEISVVSKSGNINITFNKELGDYASLNQIRYISNLKTETGSVNIEGVDKINLELFENSDANITIKYHKLIDKNEYIINSSSLRVVLPINQPLYLNVNVTSADVFIAVGTATLNNNNYTGGYQKDVYGLESGNELYINSCGEIIVLSEDIADAM
ncbi:MAG: DUF4097 family beta strand repeat protein, partial [Clostridia bacterium]|nr:DUF4097 family beta strand repeat protein [Clostridia bacterium]